jgi:hypothetical protein
VVRKLLVAFALGLAAVSSSVGLVAATSTTASAQSSAPVLPGEPTLSSGVPAYVFGYNNGPEWGEPAFSRLPSIQAAVKSSGLTFDRVWGYDNAGLGAASGDLGQGVVGQKIGAMENAGGTCLFTLGSTGDLKWLRSIVSTYGNGTCTYFEWGNEPDNGGSITSEVSQWNADIPTLKSLCTGPCYFGGPALTWEGSNGGLPSTSKCGLRASACSDDIQYFLANTNPKPDFVTYHDYPCTKSTGKAACAGTLSQMTASDTYQDLQYNWTDALADETAVLGKVIPTGISEINFDPGTANLGNWSGDATFMSQWTTTAWESIIALGIPFANIYTVMDYASGGDLDMFSDSSPYGSKAQFSALAAEVKKYGGLVPITNVVVPSNGATVSGSIALDATASSPVGVDSVNFEVSGGSLAARVIGTAVSTAYGWVTSWNTANVADGTYKLQSVATDAHGRSATSPAMSVTVGNIATQILVPKSGSKLSGNGSTITSSDVLDAQTIGPKTVKGITVTFVLSGGTLTDKVIGTAVPTIYGWLALANTTGVPKGTYVLQSVATRAGITATSAGVKVSVSN